MFNLLTYVNIHFLPLAVRREPLYRRQKSFLGGGGSVWAYFGIVEKLNQHSTTLQLYQSDLEKNTEFRIGWPRGTLGSLPADSEQFMLIEDLYKQVEKLQIQQEAGMHNKVNIEFIQKQLEKALEDIEMLKDKARDMHYKNGNGS